MSAYNSKDGTRYTSNGAMDNYSVRQSEYTGKYSSGGYYGSSAYDLSLFERTTPGYVRKTQPGKKKKSTKTAKSGTKSYTTGKSASTTRRTGDQVKKTSSPAKKKTATSAAAKQKSKTAAKVTSLVKPYDRKAVIRWTAIGLFFAVAVSMLVASNMENNELTAEIEKATATLEVKQQDYEALCVEFDTKMSDAAVEEYAQTVLGMQKRENSQTEWISLGSGDIFETGDGGSAPVWESDKITDLLSYYG